MRLVLTDKAILVLQFTASGQQIARDAELPGFFVMLGKKPKTFMVQGDLRQNGKRQSLRLKVGKVGEVRTREARAKAKAWLGLIGKGVDPRPKEAGEGEAPNLTTSRPEGSPDIDLTLRAAWTRYRDAHLKRKGRSEGTIENCRDHADAIDGGLARPAALGAGQ